MLQQIEKSGTTKTKIHATWYDIVNKIKMHQLCALPINSYHELMA